VARLALEWVIIAVVVLVNKAIKAMADLAVANNHSAVRIAMVELALN
jgi:hypothetical protein